jgi:hypothetical protein
LTICDKVASGKNKKNTLNSGKKLVGRRETPSLSLTIPNWLSFFTTQGIVTVDPACATITVLFGLRKATRPPSLWEDDSTRSAGFSRTADVLGGSGPDK